MKKYDLYKDSGIDWIGKIPRHWEVKKFGSISYMKGRIGWQGLKQAEFTSNPEDPFLITGMNFHDGKIRWDEVYHILEERYNEAPEIQLRESDVLFTKDGTIGKLLFVDSIPYPYKASLNSHLLVLRSLNDAYKPRFLYYQLQSLPFKHHVELTKTGTTFYGITQEAMGQYKALVPTHEEQTAIATYLDRKTAEIDELIADKKRLLELYEEEKNAIINQAVTKGLNHYVPMKDSGIEWLGEIPEHWEVKKVKHLVLKVGSGVTPSGGASVYQLSGIPLLRSQNIHFNGLRLEDVAYITEEIHESMKNSQVYTGDVLLNITGASIGRVYFVENWLDEANVNQHVCILRPNPDIDTKFLYLIMRSNIGQGQIRNEQTGSGREGLNFEALKNFIVPFFPLEEQRTIVQHIETECNRIDTQVERTKRLIELLKEYREALISEAVTGQIKVIDE